MNRRNRRDDSDDDRPRRTDEKAKFSETYIAVLFGIAVASLATVLFAYLVGSPSSGQFLLAASAFLGVAVTGQCLYVLATSKVRSAVVISFAIAIISVGSSFWLLKKERDAEKWRATFMSDVLSDDPKSLDKYLQK